jgi:dienelactone hydrolase
MPMNKKSLYLSSFFLFCMGTIMNAQQQETKLICMNNCTVNPQTVFLFAHGIDLRSNTCTNQAKIYIESNIITGPCHTFDFGDGLKTINLGQENDCALFLSAYTQLRTKHPQASIVLVGLSRGAVTILNTVALHPEIDWSPVKAALLESPYAHVSAMAEQIASSYMFFVPFKQSLMRKIVNSLPSYNPDGMQPIDMIEKMKPSFPIFIAYSEADKTVPAAGTQLIIEKLKSAGHTVTSWSSKTGKHSMLGSNAAREFLKSIN